MNAMKEAWLYESIGKKIREVRRSKMLNQQELASRVKLSRTSLVNIEQGSQHVSLHYLWRIAVGLGVDLQNLLPTPAEISEIQKLAKASAKLKNRNDEQVRSFIELSEEIQRTQSNRSHES